MTKEYERPTSEWEHSHALESGDRIVDVERNVNGLVERVNDSGSVIVGWQDGEEKHTEEEITTSLADGTIETEEGLSYELATF